MGSVLFNEGLYFQSSSCDNSSQGTLDFAQEIGWLSGDMKVSVMEGHLKEQVCVYLQCVYLSIVIAIVCPYSVSCYRPHGM